jgi:hypothetical protein
MLRAAESTEIFSKLLSDYYQPFELWHLRNSVTKVSPSIAPSIFVLMHP